MKFFELVALFKNSINELKVKNKDNPSLRYILTAYNNVVSKLQKGFSENEEVTVKKIYEMDITDHMKDKLITICRSRISKRVMDEIHTNKKENKLRQELDELLGIGTKKINDLVTAGLKDIKQLQRKKWFDMLNLDTQMVVTHHPNRAIRYNDIVKLESLLTGFRKDIMLVGSYRRKKPVIRDIDILFTLRGKNDIEKYIEYLKKIFDDRIWFYSEGTTKASFIFQPDVNKDIKYKADMFIATPENYYSMLLYATGSQQFNIKMRRKAKNLGYLLNQNGIYKGKKKINKSSDNERKLFSLLDMEYVEPEKRF